MVKQRKGVKELLITPIKAMEPKSAKPTPEQMRIAQILEKKVVDSTIKLKLKQIMDATQRSAEEVYVALHDSDFDVNRAVNLLIEGEDQLGDWCTNEKKKKKLAELKEKKEEAIEVEVSQPEKNISVRGRGDDKRRPGRRQDGGRRLPRQQGESKQQGELPKQPGELKKQPVAPRAKRPGFGSMVFERSNPPPIDTGLLPPVKNHWEKPLVCNRTTDEDEFDFEEFQGSLSQTQIFTSSKKYESQEMQKITKESSPRPVPPLPSLTFTNKVHEHDELPATPQRGDTFTELRQNNSSSSDRTSTPPTESRPVSVRMGYAKNGDPKPPSKIPTSAVEMPPELMPSLSFLDIQFGAMDLCPLETSSESQSNATSQNSSATTLMPLSSTPSSCSMSHLMANINKGSSIINTKSSPGVQACTDSPGMGNIANSQSTNIVSIPPGLNAGLQASSITNIHQNINQSLNSITSSPRISTSITNSCITTSAVPSSSISGSISHLMTQNSIQPGGNIATSNTPNASHMVPNNINHNLIGTSATNQNRFMPSSQAFNGSHLQYGIINPSGSSHGYESRETAPPPHLPQPHSHLPPFKSPPGVPKGTMVPNLPGPIVSNQYIVGQGNVPYFPHPPIYYYEEVPPVMNSQQRLANMTSHTHHYDVSYQTAPSSRDSVHYNV